MSTLCDKTINSVKAFCINETFNQKNVKGGCYEATILEAEYFEKNDQEMRSQLITQDPTLPIIVRPGCQIVCKTKEFFAIPKNYIAQVVLKGRYFSLGIAPVNTVAEPGFTGHLGIVLNNTSKNYIKFKPGEPIVKLIFHELDQDCTNEYKDHHSGEQKTWALREDFIATPKEIKDSGLFSNKTVELEKTYGNLLAQTVKDVKATKTTYILSLFFSLAATCIVLFKFASDNVITTILINILSSIVATTICTFIVPMISSKLTKKD